MRLILALFLFPFYLSAFYSGNPFSPTFLQKGFLFFHNPVLSVGVGYLGDYVLDKKLVLEDRDGINIGRIDHFQMESQMSYLSIILVKRLEMYSSLGVSREKLDWTPIVNTPSDTDLSANNHFSYSVGSRVILLDLHALCLSFDCNYFSLPSSEKVKEKLQNLSFPFSLGEQTLKWKEWSFSLGSALKIGPFSPYFGGKYSKAKLKVTSTKSSDVVRSRNKNLWGIFAGVSIIVSKTLYLTGEWRHYDEKGYSGSAVFAF